MYLRLCDAFDGTADPVEEGGIDLARLEMLQPFEHSWQGTVEQADAGTLKDMGNTLWGLKDYEAATQYYANAMKRLTPAKSTG